MKGLEQLLIDRHVMELPRGEAAPASQLLGAAHESGAGNQPMEVGHAVRDRYAFPSLPLEGKEADAIVSVLDHSDEDIVSHRGDGLDEGRREVGAGEQRVDLLDL